MMPKSRSGKMVKSTTLLRVRPTRSLSYSMTLQRCEFAAIGVLSRRVCIGRKLNNQEQPIDKNKGVSGKLGAPFCWNTSTMQGLPVRRFWFIDNGSRPYICTYFAEHTELCQIKFNTILPFYNINRATFWLPLPKLWLDYAAYWLLAFCVWLKPRPKPPAYEVA